MLYFIKLSPKLSLVMKIKCLEGIRVNGGRKDYQKYQLAKKAQRKNWMINQMNRLF